MSFAESEYPVILAEIDRLLQGPNPFEAIAKVREIIRIHDRIPLYPGLTRVVGFAVNEEKAATELAVGDLVAWSENGRFFSGVVAKVGAEGATVTEVRAGGPEAGRVLKVQKVTRVTRDALERKWPTLVFPEAGKK